MTYPGDRKNPECDATKVVTVDLSPDGNGMVSGSADGEVALWDMASLTKVEVLVNQSAGIQKVKFSPDGKLVAATNDQNQLSLIQVRSKRKKEGFFRKIFNGSKKPNRPAEGWLDVTFSADGRIVATAAQENIANIFNVDPLRKIKSLRGDKVVALSPDGDLLASANFVHTMDEDYFEVVVVSVETGTGRAVTRKKSWVNALAFSPDGKFLACGIQEGLGLGDRSHNVAVWSLPDYDRLPNEIKHERGELMDYITGVVFTPNGKNLVSACIDGTVSVWRVGHWDRVQTLAWDGAEITSLAATDTHVAVTAKELGFSVWG